MDGGWMRPTMDGTRVVRSQFDNKLFFLKLRSQDDFPGGISLAGRKSPNKPYNSNRWMGLASLEPRCRKEGNQGNPGVPRAVTRLNASREARQPTVK